VRVSISDGPGIADEILDKVFDPFFTTKPVGMGAGLGLSISYGVVKEHGGTIGVESTPAGGATFIIELPA
jgi:signal transduction histidine kinase